MFIDWLVHRGDPLSNMEVTFASKEDATAFCEKNGNWCVCVCVVWMCVCVCVSLCLYVFVYVFVCIFARRSLINTETFGERSFSYAGPSVGNNLP